jgi:hypothetical protein
MAKASIEIIEALRSTADKLQKASDYQWGHMGSCNCGFLAQQLTHLSKHQIHSRAMQRYGDWNEQLNDYCPSSGLLMDDLITDLVKVGFSIEDLKNLEMLSDQAVLGSLPKGRKHLRKNVKSDVIEYLSAWANLLEDQLIASVNIPESLKRLVAKSLETA